jgi:hypothetical protein
LEGSVKTSACSIRVFSSPSFIAIAIIKFSPVKRILANGSPFPAAPDMMPFPKLTEADELTEDFVLVLPVDAMEEFSLTHDCDCVPDIK